MRHRSVRGPYSGSASLEPFTDICCWPGCEADADESVAPLCRSHLGKAYRTFKECYLSALEVQLDSPLNRSLAREGRAPRLPKGWTEGLVYFVRFGGLVKIGWTSDLKQRMAAVPNEEVLGTVPGTMEDEKRCHTAFAHLKVKGEWFRPAPDLMAFIADVTAKAA